jgi:RNA polymerase sigma-32 factor
MAVKKTVKKTTKKIGLPKKKAAKKPLKKIAATNEGFRSVKPEVIDRELPEQPSHDDAIPERAAPTTSYALTTTDTVSRYLSEIHRYPLLTREKENEIAIRYRETGDPKAAELLVTSNLRFVVKVAAEYSKFGAKLIDLIQEGNVGLMHAVREFNPYKGVRLITYAVWWIRGYIQEYLMRQYSMVRIGTTATQKKLFYQLQREKQNLEKMGLEHGIAQLSGRLGISEEEITNMQQRLSSRDVSLDQPLNDDGSNSLSDMQTDLNPSSIDDQLGLQEELAQMHANIEAIRPTLSERELILLETRLLADDPLTLQEIGDKYGITREAVRQMEARLMEKIRKQMKV